MERTIRIVLAWFFLPFIAAFLLDSFGPIIIGIFMSGFYLGKGVYA